MARKATRRATKKATAKRGAKKKTAKRGAAKKSTAKRTTKKKATKGTAKKTTRTRKSSSRREAILKTATQLFAQKGFDGTSLREIGKAVGFAPQPEAELPLVELDGPLDVFFCQFTRREHIDRGF